MWNWYWGVTFLYKSQMQLVESNGLFWQIRQYCLLDDFPTCFHQFVSLYSLFLTLLFLNINGLYPTNQNSWLLTKCDTACIAWVYDIEIWNHKSLYIPGGINRCYTIMLLQYSSQTECLQTHDSFWVIMFWNITLFCSITSEKIHSEE